MRLRIFNAKLLTMEKGREIFDGELWVIGNRIAYLGNPLKEDPCRESSCGGKNGGASPGAEGTTWDREIDAKGNLLMPGFKNAHTHSAMTFLRSYADDMPLMDWLDKKVFPFEARLTKEDIYELSRLAIMEYLTSGITANFDMYLNPEAIAGAAVDCGFRTVQTSGFNKFGPPIEELEETYLKYNREHELLSFILGFHAEYTTPEPLLKELAALARKYRAPVFTHNSETRREVEQCVKAHNRTPTAYLDSLGMFDYGGGGYHCVYMTEEDLSICKEKGLWVVTNPASNAKLASGIAPIQKMLDKGIRLAIGTDGPASNNCLDMFREMFLTTALAKLREEDAAAVDANEVLFMATVGGAGAMGLKDCDVLAEGKLADFIMIDLKQPNMQPLNNITKNLVYAGSKQNVKMTAVNGKILYEDGEFHIGVDADELYKKANAIIGRIKCESTSLSLGREDY